MNMVLICVLVAIVSTSIIITIFKVFNETVEDFKEQLNKLMASDQMNLKRIADLNHQIDILDTRQLITDKMIDSVNERLEDQSKELLDIKASLNKESSDEVDEVVKHFEEELTKEENKPKTKKKSKKKNNSNKENVDV